MGEYEDMAAKLRAYGPNAGFAALGTGVVIVGPGAPFAVEATWYDAAELEKAADAGILERRKLSGSLVLDIYAAK